MLTATQTQQGGELHTLGFPMDHLNPLIHIITVTLLVNSVILVFIYTVKVILTCMEYLPVKCQTVGALLLKPVSGYTPQGPVSFKH